MNLSGLMIRIRHPMVLMEGAFWKTAVTGCPLFSFETEMLRLMKMGICLRDAFERWRNADAFLHMPNHPSVEVSFDFFDCGLELACWQDRSDEFDAAKARCRALPSMHDAPVRLVFSMTQGNLKYL
jgi:hypothetical protein